MAEGDGVVFSELIFLRPSTGNPLPLFLTHTAQTVCTALPEEWACTSLGLTIRGRHSSRIVGEREYRFQVKLVPVQYQQESG
jgi:hypothetical protein